MGSTNTRGKRREIEKKVAQAYIERKWRGALAITFTLDSRSLHSIVYKEGKKGRHLMSVEGGKSIKNGSFHCIVQHGSRKTIFFSLYPPHVTHRSHRHTNHTCCCTTTTTASIHPSPEKKRSQDPITPHGSLSVTTTINQNPNSIDPCYTITPFVFVWGGGGRESPGGEVGRMLIFHDDLIPNGLTNSKSPLIPICCLISKSNPEFRKDHTVQSASLFFAKFVWVCNTN